MSGAAGIDIVQPSDAGAATEVELKELKHGIEDAVRSATAGNR